MSVKENRRSANFSEGEKTTLINLVYQYKTVLENKKTDAASNQKKAEVWAKVAEKFNAASGRSPRDASNLRSKYDDLKKNLRKKIGNNQREIYKTGGGSAIINNLSSDEEILLSLIGASTCWLKDRGGGDKEICLNIIESTECTESLEASVELLLDKNIDDDLSFRPSEAVNILKRPIQKALSSHEVHSDEENIEPQSSFPTLECYGKPKKKKRSNDKLDELIEKYSDLKNERKGLLIECSNTMIVLNLGLLPVSRYLPDTTTDTSSAYAVTLNPIDLISIRSGFNAKFRRSGDRTPPCGVPRFATFVTFAAPISEIMIR
ncbi:hypothetical protein FF38_07250 [Lucilia cuprina]|uniref:Regulatory protein zeste n=1 Tax=Lucilia cuprina TaxID=7375 RepID=A0A0L0BU16_LUCCU|nr:hypothetical protein FF38_07250 [Lucilia cuprina]